MKEIKVSVCITAYNVEKYIAETLDSILKQRTSFEYEILVGDDYSSDSTREILKKYQKKYPDKIRLHFQNKNVGVCRNDYELINLAQGKYIAWCDGDDYWETNNKLEQQVAILDKSNCFSGVYTAWFDYYEIANKLIKHYPQKLNLNQTDFGKKGIEKLLKGEITGIRFSTLMFRKEIILKFWEEESLEYLKVPHKQNDFFLFCILVNEAPLYLLNEITTVYRIREESLSFTKSKVKRFHYLLAYLHLISYIIIHFSVTKPTTQIVTRRILSSLLLDIFNKIVDRHYLSEIQYLCKKVNYHYSIGETILIYTIQIDNKFLTHITKILINLRLYLQQRFKRKLQN